MKNLKLLLMVLTVFATFGLFPLLQAKDEPPISLDQDKIFGAVITSIEQKLSTDKGYEVDLTLSARTKDDYAYAGLTKENLKVTDGDLSITDLKISQATQSEEAWAMVILLDVSSSMLKGKKIDKAKEAVSSFIDSIGSNDQVLIITFSNDVEPAVGFSSDKAELKSAVAKIESSKKNTKTKLYDAIADSAKRFENIKLKNRSVVVITDGQDIGSAISFAVCYAPHLKKDIKIYTVPIGKSADRDILKMFADATGGRTFPVDLPDELSGVFQRLLDKSTGEYTITYTIPTDTIYPTGSKEPLAGFQIGSTRNVKITVTDRNGAVKTPDKSYAVAQLPPIPLGDGSGNANGKPNWFLIGGIGVLVLGMLFLLTRLFKRKRSSPQYGTPQPDMQTGKKEILSEPEVEETTGGDKPTFPYTPEPALTPIIPTVTKPEPTVQPWGFIEIIEAPDNPDIKGKLIGLTKPEMVIGKGTAGVDITLPGLPAKDKPDHDESSISSVHCSVKLENRAMIITDLGSTNGVFINRKAKGDWERIESKKPVTIGLEDLIRLGRQKGYYIFRIRLSTDEIKLDETLVMNP